MREGCLTSCHSWFSSSVNVQQNLFYSWVEKNGYNGMFKILDENVTPGNYHTLPKLKKCFWIFLCCLASRFFLEYENIHHNQLAFRAQKISSLTTPKRIIKTTLTYWTSCLFLIGITIAQLSWYLPNMNMIWIIKHVLLQDCKFP